MWQLGTPPFDLILRSAIVYVAFILGLRVFGKREVGQFTLFDLALILLAANALQPAITGPDNSITGGVIVVGTMFALNLGVSRLRERVPLVRRILEPQPTVLARDGAWLAAAVEREGLDDADLEAALREHGLAHVEDVSLAVLEDDGSISVVPVDGVPAVRRRRRLRYRRPG